MARLRLILPMIPLLLVFGFLGGLLSQLAREVTLSDAWAGFSPRPPVSVTNSLTDDVTLNFGDGGDTMLSWSTADASDHYFSTVILGSSDMVVAQDPSVDWGIAGSNALRVQSPDAVPAKYVRIRHNGTAGLIDAGSGPLELSSAAKSLDLSGTYLRRVETCTCNHNEASKACVSGLQANDIVATCAMFVSVAWDGNGTVACKTDVASSNLLIQNFTNANLQLTGWNVASNQLRGGWKDIAVPLAAGDDSVDCTPTIGTSSQGTATMYIIIERFG